MWTPFIQVMDSYQNDLNLPRLVLMLEYDSSAHLPLLSRKWGIKLQPEKPLLLPVSIFWTLTEYEILVRVPMYITIIHDIQIHIQ